MHMYMCTGIPRDDWEQSLEHVPGSADGRHGCWVA